MHTTAGSHNDLYAKRRASRILATAVDTPRTGPSFRKSSDPAFVRVKLARISIDLFLITLGGFSNSSAGGKNRRWTEEDTALLRQLWSQGMKRAEMARCMKRSLFMIYKYAWEIDLPRVRAPR